MPAVLDPVTQHELKRTAQRLRGKSAGIVSGETSERCIGESLDLLGGSRIEVFGPVRFHTDSRLSVCGGSHTWKECS